LIISPSLYLQDFQAGPHSQDSKKSENDGGVSSVGERLQLKTTHVSKDKRYLSYYTLGLIIKVYYLVISLVTL